MIRPFAKGRGEVQWACEYYASLGSWNTEDGQCDLIAQNMAGSCDCRNIGELLYEASVVILIC